MQAVSDRFAEAMDSRPYIARITLDGVDVIEGEAVENIDFSGGAGDSDEAVSLGSTVAATVEIVLQKEMVSVALAGREMTVELGITLDGETEWIPMGSYTAGDVTEDDGCITVPGTDAMAAKFDREYEALEGVNFANDGGVDALAFVQALCLRRGVAADLTGMETVYLTQAPTGYTERRILGMIAALYGKFAYIDRLGVLRFGWYTAVDARISADNYYSDGMEKASYTFVAGWMKCYVEGLEETLCQGDSEAEQGIYTECIWMDEERLASLWGQLEGFSYRPVAQLRFQGDPRLDPGDIISMEDLSGESVSVPVMGIRHEYDGGLITELSAQGQLKTDGYEGPVQREVKRTTAKILKRAASIELSVQQTGSQVENLGASMELLADEVSVKFTENVQQTEAVNGQLQSFLTKFSKYIKFASETAITIGSGDSSLTLEIDNETGIVFKKNGVQFGWWDGVDFHTGNIVVNVNERAQFGNFAFVPRSDGSLSFLKVGG